MLSYRKSVEISWTSTNTMFKPFVAVHFILWCIKYIEWSRNTEGQGHEPDMFKAYILKTCQDSGLVSMEHL